MQKGRYATERKPKTSKTTDRPTDEQTNGRTDKRAGCQSDTSRVFGFVLGTELLDKLTTVGNGTGRF
ncbi:Hypothetical predicted protein [Octopus vulgaris]|uniref:Uncharacterized protein n=1 Tax=Octopus vulgaris TaxID=6645 RepID=A0AA36BS17_OCTVU|nr:Hypothetical predicted protein [Octopus vulgaris]